MLLLGAGVIPAAFVCKAVLPGGVSKKAFYLFISFVCKQMHGIGVFLLLNHLYSSVPGGLLILPEWLVIRVEDEVSMCPRATPSSILAAHC